MSVQDESGGDASSAIDSLKDTIESAISQLTEALGDDASGTDEAG
jgi:hypothetical protein